jgi:phenylalanyl-tRNA synthetase beta chain
LGEVHRSMLNKFDIKQSVFFADIDWSTLMAQTKYTRIQVQEIPKFPVVHRDLAIVVSSQTKYEDAKRLVQKLKLNQLEDVSLFDVFESEKLGAQKKSMAFSFTFSDREKTLTDKEIDSMMNRIMTTLEKELGAEIRK